MRKECVEGLARVLGLRRVQWARQVGALNLLPTYSMLTLLDKKFGGELSKEDVQVIPSFWLVHIQSVLLYMFEPPNIR